MTNLNTIVEVPLWAVLYAIRYGQHRASYASTDAVGLAEMFWPVLPPFIRRQLCDDWEQWRGGALGPPEEVAHRWAILAATTDRQEGTA